MSPAGATFRRTRSCSGSPGKTHKGWIFEHWDNGSCINAHYPIGYVNGAYICLVLIVKPSIQEQNFLFIEALYPHSVAAPIRQSVTSQNLD